MKQNVWLVLLAVSVFVLCMCAHISNVLVKPQSEINTALCLEVNNHPLPPPKSQLTTFITKTLQSIHDNQRPLCVLEVGTADGTGTTVSLFHALHTHCAQRKGFQLYTYEVDSRNARKARETWSDRECVEVVNEIVLDEAVMDEFIVQQIEGPESASYPGEEFYRTFYSNLKHCIGTNSCGSYFHTAPPCTLDLVLIDGTRFSHAGIVESVRGLTSPTTMFIIENDHWTSESALGGSELNILRQFWNLTVVETAHPTGEQWPWVSFKINKPV